MKLKELTIAAATAFAVAGCATKPMTDEEIAKAEARRSGSIDGVKRPVREAPKSVWHRLTMPLRVLEKGPAGQFGRDVQYEICRSKGTCGTQGKGAAEPQK